MGNEEDERDKRKNVNKKRNNIYISTILTSSKGVMNRRRKKAVYSNFHFFGGFSHFYRKVPFISAENQKTQTFLKVTVVKRLLSAGAEVNEKNEEYDSALAAAAYTRETEIVKFLFQEGKADVNMQLRTGKYGSALAAASWIL